MNVSYKSIYNDCLIYIPVAYTYIYTDMGTMIKDGRLHEKTSNLMKTVNV
jgi:hypothetical protein